MEAGIVGLSYIGKTALFNAMTALGLDAAGGSAAKPNVGMVNVPDPRLEIIHEYVETKKIVPATIQLVDVAGLAAGASKGEGMGNKFLAHIRNVDAIIHVARCFEDASVPHVHERIDPVSDIEEVETELLLADLEVVENSIRNAQRKARTGEKEAKMRLELMEQCQQELEASRPLRSLLPALDEQKEKILRSFAMLSAKPVLYVANIGEDEAQDAPAVEAVRKYAGENGGEAVAVCARLEAELAELEPGERDEMLAGLGLTEPALNVVARAAYKLLGLQSFFTAGPKEIRAWTTPIGATGPQAAGVIHSDFERGFIRVEVYTVADLQEHRTEQAIKAAGKMRTEGKDYVVQDGDVCHFLFNV
ncbi:MAG: redox-regulated ATPase YchF [Phycisphaeraceae bacterium]|nr:redox-regulated ATPase YchF [Phycisphaeraceae bacterium]